MVIENSYLKPLNNPSFHLNKEQKVIFKPARVIYAGTSKRREKLVRLCFPETPVERMEIGPELKTDDVVHVSSNKIKDVIENNYLHGDELIIAADTRTKIPEINDERKAKFVSKGKPATIQEIYNNLVAVSTKLTYQIDSGASTFHVNGKPTLLSTRDTCQINLRPEVLAFLITDEGFNQYLTTFEKFYESSAYSTHNLEGVTPFDLSAGLSLPVLMQLNAVDSVHGIETSSQLFPEVLKHAIYIAAVGIPSDILTPFGVDSDNIISDWVWLNAATKSALP
jgi:hypothetical protein